MDSRTVVTAVCASLMAGGPLLAGGIRSSGEVESTSGGFRFPDSSVQTTAAVDQLSGLSCEPGEAVRWNGFAFTCCAPGSTWVDDEAVCHAKCDIDAPSGFNDCVVNESVEGRSFGAGTILISNVRFLRPVRNVLFGRGGTATDNLDVMLDNVSFESDVSEVQFRVTGGIDSPGSKHLTLSSLHFRGTTLKVLVDHSCGLGSNDNQLVVNFVTFPGPHFFATCPEGDLPDGVGGSCTNQTYTCP